MQIFVTIKTESMSYENKKGAVISRRDFEKIKDKDTRKEYQPSAKIPTHSLNDDGELSDIPEADRKSETSKSSPPAPDAPPTPEQGETMTPGNIFQPPS